MSTGTPPPFDERHPGGGPVGHGPDDQGPDQGESVEVDGQLVWLPVHVRSASQVSATWMVDADRAQEIVDPTGLQVARVGPSRGSTTCSVAVVQYADNDLGPYNEIAVAFAVCDHRSPQTPPAMNRPITYIHRLPVNAEFTCKAGRQIWGFPKWLTSITIERRSGATDAVLIDDGRLVCAVHAGRGWVPVPAKPLEMISYSQLDGVLRRTTWTTTSHGAKLRPGGTSVTLGEDHVMAEELRSLGVHRRRPLFTMAVSAMTAEFGTPEVIATLSVPQEGSPTTSTPNAG